MDLLALVDRLEELVGSAQKMPIGSRAIVDRRRLLDLVDQMRIAIPQEVRDAREMVAQREQHRLEADEEARLIVARAEDRAARLVEQHELTLAARARAEEVAHQAEQRIEERIAQANADIEHRIAESRRLASQQMDAADEYARELLGRLDRQLQAFVRSVQSGIAQLEPAAPAHAEEPRSARNDDRPGGREPELEEERTTTGGGPIPLRREETAAAPRTSEGGLENLLRRRTAPAEALSGESDDTDEVPEAPVVIDDFQMPDFDDRPAPADGERER